MGECKEIYRKEDNFTGLDLSILNDGGKRIFDMVVEVKIDCSLSDHVKALGLTQGELTQITGIRQATISDLLNKRKTTLSIPHMLVLMVVLKVPRLSDLFDITFDAETVNKLNTERKEWEKTKKIPKELVNLMVKNVLDRTK